jgi:NAD(P)-dependent dehydrogenase (short-subunit alcohol dehydrogenase family)
MIGPASFSLEGRRALVTGGATGIGAAIAVAFAACGADVAVTAHERGGDEVLGAIRKLGRNAEALPADLRSLDEAGAAALLAAAETRLGPLDILVNNAGIIHTADFLDIAEADFDRVLRTNLKGMFLIGQAAAKQMVAQVKAGKPPGAIVNMSSINARVAIPNQVPYCVSKGGVDQLTKVMALSLAPHGIRVNAIGPGSIMTDILKGVAADKAAQNRLLSRTPLGRIADPDEIASVAAFLASKEASYLTGETIYVDGGRLALNYTVPVVDQ